MIDALIWAVGGVCLLAVLTLLFEGGKPPLPPPSFDVPVPNPTNGPHAIIARGIVDSGHFVLLRTPLYEFPFNTVLITQVFFNAGGAMQHARYCRIETLKNGLVEVGCRGGKAVHVRVGSGVGLQLFPDDPETIWTH